MGKNIVVLGAGIVGASTAAWLVWDGHDVTIVDRDPPGQGCSSGNAGMLGTASCLPSALPGVLRRVPAMLLPRGPLSLDWRYLPTLAPWLLRFVLAGRPVSVAANARAMNAIQTPLLAAHLELADWADAGHLIANRGKLHFWFNDASWHRDAVMRDLLTRHSIAFEIISGADARQRVPALAPTPNHAMWFENIRQCTDPGALVTAYLAASENAGARILRTEARDIECDAHGGGRLVTEGETIGFDTLVIAAGIWSSALARKLGDNIPLISQRGYHVMHADPGITLDGPFKCEDRKIIITPMDGGIRVTGIAELAPPGRPPTPGRARSLVRAARELLPDLPAEGWSEWMGSRPCTPDSRPVIGRSRASADVIYACGHGHWGFGQGAITGRLVAQLAAGSSTDIPLEAYRPERFANWFR